MFFFRNRIATFATGLAMMALGCLGQAPSITLDGAGTGRVFEGEGAISAGASSRLLIDYPEPYRGQILDYLFKPNYGANLQDLKVEIGGDMNSTAGSEPSHMHTSSDQNYNRGYEWWLMEQAKLRNPNIVLSILAWGAPGWIGNGQFFSQDAINYIVNFIQGAKVHHNLTIDYVGILDERPYDQYWIIQLKAALQAQNLATKIVAADESGGQIVQDMLSNPALMAAVDAVGFHYPRFDGGPILANKPIWGSEDGQTYTWNGNWPGAAYLAQAYIRGYISSKITKHEVWSLVTSYYDNLLFPGSGQMYANTPWSGNYLVQPAIWAIAHTNQFAGPGWQYIDSSCGFLGSGSYMTLKKGSDFSLIIENVSGSDTPATFSIVNGLSTGVLHVWKSDETAQFIQQADIVPVNGTFSFTVAAGAIYSITTTTGQGKGNATPPPAAPFPFPYADNFDSEAIDGQAKYFFDLNGSFEIANCAGGRTGRCLRQAAPLPPIPWTTIGSIQPSSVIGSTSWDNYQVSADVFFEQPGTVKLMGRISGVNVNSGDSYGYQLYVDQLGNWTLTQGNFVSLATGSVGFGAGAWHTLKMIFIGGNVQAFIDGLIVANRTTDDTYPRGMAGVGVQSWTTAQFDNFRIDPIPGAGTPVSQSQITATATGYAPGYEPAKAIDGDSGTFWISPFTCVGGCQPTQPLPQSLTLALGGAYSVQAVTYLPRQDNNLGGTITSYNVYVSSDGTNFTKVATGSWTADATLKSVSFTPTSASYVRIEAVSALGGLAAASEVNVNYDTGVGSTNPAPAIGSLSPNSATAGNGGFVLSVLGSNFIAGSVVRWNGTDRTTNFVNSTALSAVIPATDLASVGTAVVTVVNPAPGGGVSSGQSFSINSTTGGGGGPPVTATFVTARASSTLRNDFGGWVGMKLTVGANPLSVSSLGRICIANNAQTHIVKFVSASNGIDVPGASVPLNMAGCAAGQFVYGAISPVTLPAGASYYLVSQEMQGGDQWYDQAAISTVPVAAVNSTAYFYSGSWYSSGSANTSYVPPNFQYSVVTPSPITVNVAASPAGPSFIVDGSTSTAAQTLTWSSGTSHTIAAPSPQSAGVGTQYAWSGWSDNGAISHTVAPTGDTTYTANFTTQYLLTTSVSPAGSGTIAASPSSTGGYYNSGTSVQLTATAAANCAFSNWSGNLAGSTNQTSITMSAPQTVTANFQCSGPPPAAFLTGYALNGPSLRNDLTGLVGMKLTVGANPLTVSALGRICVANNAQTHTVKFVNVSDGSGVAGASASVNMAGCTAGQFVYASIAPATLTAGSSYYLVSQETQSGDRWYDQGAISTKTDAAVNSTAYFYNGVWYAAGSANTSYVPPNFQYSVVTPEPITVNIVASPAGVSLSVDGSASTTAQTLTWGSGTSHTISATSAQNAGTGTQYAWIGWSDGGAISHTVAPTGNITYTASFATQYLLTANVSPAGGGSISAGGYYNSGTPLTLTATPAAGCTFQNWSGVLSGTTNPQPITMSAPQTVTANFQCSGPPPVGFVTGYALGGQSLRSDFAGWVGMKLTVGANPLAVSALGRICVANNAQTHTVRFVNASDGSDVAGASAAVNMAGCTAGQFVYQAISPATLAAGSSYYLASQEAQGGDRWYEQGAISTKTDAAVNGAAYFYNGAWYAGGSVNTSYVPPNFQYSVVTPSPITVNVAASPAGLSLTVDGSVSTTAQTLTWTSGTSHTIAATSPQSAGAGSQYAWSGWSDGGAISHTVAPVTGITYTANFTMQYQLTSVVSPAGGGTIAANPSSPGGYYSSGTSLQLTATPAANCTFSSWSGSLAGLPNPTSIIMSAPQTATANFQCSAPPPAAFLTGYALNGPSLRNDFTGWVGMKLTLGTAPLSVSALGRICVANNSQTHTVKFVKVSDGSDLAGASASVNMAGCTPGQFVYSSITPITLAAGASYYLASQETQGGDRWYDQGSISTKTDAVVKSAAYLYNGTWYPAGAAYTYVPPNFQYSVAGP